METLVEMYPDLERWRREELLEAMDQLQRMPGWGLFKQVWGYLVVFRQEQLQAEDNEKELYRAQGGLRALHEVMTVFNSLPDGIGDDDDEEV